MFYIFFFFIFPVLIFFLFSRAFFVSRELEGSSIPRCLSFWFYMYEPIVDNTGPNLGKLAVWTRTIDRYRLTVKGQSLLFLFNLYVTYMPDSQRYS